MSHYPDSLFAADHHDIKGNILLLRDPTFLNNEDLYESAFAKTKHTPFLIPVLEMVLTNIAQLASVTPQDNFDGVFVIISRSYEV